jgi:hypothetical protein
MPLNSFLMVPVQRIMRFVEKKISAVFVDLSTGQVKPKSIKLVLI